VNIAAVIYSGYMLLQEKHNNPVKKKFFYKIINCCLENLYFIWKNMMKVPAQKKWL